MPKLAGKVALITGAAGGQGVAEAELFVREGAAVVLTDIDAAGGEALMKRLTAEGARVLFRVHDAASEAAWTEIVAATLSAFGGLNILVNNAGTIARQGIVNTTVEAWNRTLAVNLTGPLLGMKHCAPAIRDTLAKTGGGGSIVNISSTAGLTAHDDAAYTASKRGLRGLTKTAVLQFSPWNIRVNVLAYKPCRPYVVGSSPTRRQWRGIGPISGIRHPNSSLAIQSGGRMRRTVSGLHRSIWNTLTSIATLGCRHSGGKNRTRGDLARFLDDIKSGKVKPGDAIGVENVDRLSREGPRQAIKLLTEILDLGVLIDIRGQLVTDSFLEDNPYYWYELIGEMNRAHSESKHKSERLIATNKNKRDNVRAGNVLFAGERCPGWLMPSPDGSCYLNRDNRDKVVQQIFQWAAAGIGTPTIAIRLNKAEVPAFDKRHRLNRQDGWHAGYILKLLRGHEVRGFYQPHRYINGKRVPEGEPIECYPRIIDDELYYRARAAVQGRLTHGKGRKGANYANLIAGLGKCHVCQGSLVLYKGRQRCARSLRALCDNRLGFPNDRMEQWILALPTLVMPDVLASLIPPVEKSENPIQVLENTIATKEAQIGELFEKFAGNSNATIRAHAERQIERLGAEIEADKAALEKAKLETRMVEFADPAGFIERIEAAKALLGSTDLQTLYDARARLAQELRQRVDVVLLNPDRSMIVRVNEGRRASLAAIEFTFTADRLLEVRSMLRDGSTLLRFAGGSFDAAMAAFQRNHLAKIKAA